MKLIDIIRADQDRYTDMHVCADTIYGTVSIEDTNNFQDSIFLQGDDASEFISQAYVLYNELEHVTMSECYHHLAIPYAENLWN